MTDWKKTYSTWFNAITAVASALLAVALYLQTQAVPWAPIAIVCITAFTVFLRSLPQGPKSSDGGTPGASGYLNAFLLPGLLACLLSAPILTGCLTKQERDCKTAFEVVEAVDIAVNCVPLDGAAYDACIDKTMDHYDPLVLSCVKDGAS